MPRCPHGDTACPCQDHDACHYEGPDAWACPVGTVVDLEVSLNAGIVHVVQVRPHCHVEGCRWPAEVCGMMRMQITAPLGREPSLREAYDLGCGFTRRIVQWPVYVDTLPPPIPGDPTQAWIRDRLMGGEVPRALDADS